MDYTGGCQCGRVRYRAHPPRDRACVCYCRMCQKASGGPFMAMVRFQASQVEWTTPPEIFASSNQVERGFCRDCGTPLTYRHLEGPYLSLTLNSLDDPESIRPEMRFCPTNQVSWCAGLDSLPAREMDLTVTPGFVNNQRGQPA
jgi:hypothetical protein